MNSDTSKFVGTWRLLSVESKAAEGQTLHTWGKNVTGRLISGPDGRMAVQLMKYGRPRFASADLRAGTDAEVRDRRSVPTEGREAFQGYTAYYGSYSVHPAGGKVVHHLEAALHPNWDGTEQVRYYRFDDDHLTLTAPPRLLAGVSQVPTLIRERVACGRRALQPFQPAAPGANSIFTEPGSSCQPALPVAHLFRWAAAALILRE
jgi:hypothetical protein